MNFSDNLTLTLMRDGVRYVGMTPSRLREAGVPDAAILDSLKDALAARVDEEAERLRGRVMTSGAGQAMEYQETQAQAFAALQAPATATSVLFPMLAASIGLDVDPKTGVPAEDVLGVARSVVAAYRRWQDAGAAIRAARLSAKAAIAAAATPEAALAVAPPWPALT